MKVTVQYYTKEGFYGPPQTGECRTVAGMAEVLMTMFDKLPDKLEGASLMDWTRLMIEVKRE